MIALRALPSSVFVVDEIERSLHPLLARLLVSKFLEGDYSSQLIFTTHETSLLDLDLLRRDEVFFAAKNLKGSSEIYSLVDFDVRKDLKIEKGYLRGRFGAIPFLGAARHLHMESVAEEPGEYGTSRE